MPLQTANKVVVSTTAPELTEAEFYAYKAVILALPDAGELGVVKATLSQWHDAVNAWWYHDEISDDVEKHVSGIGEHRRLPTDLVSKLKTLVPFEFILVAQREFVNNHVTWEHNRELAEVAGKLSWYVGELLRGREPRTNESLTAADWNLLSDVAKK